jgi:glyoxylase-like metal-dependent hydrolase (beta-lactamase superfamily II)/rhodanese-related sulfurtransferase
VQVEVIETASLGDRSYVAHADGVALVVDPQRDVDRVLEVIERVGARVACVVETHVHNDYVTGGVVLARSTGADYVHAAAEDLPVEHRPIGDGDRLTVGPLEVEARHTPGHTHHHLAYVVRHGDEPPAVFSGGSLLYGTVGRTDLISADDTEGLTRAQLRSVHRFDDLPDDTRLYPTHGFGSFCASASPDVDTDGTLGAERRLNLAFSDASEDELVDQLVAGLDDHPRYYAHMDPLNRAGPLAPDLSPPAPVDPVELRRRIHAGEWVVDLRTRRVFAAEHLAGTIGIELDDQLSTYVGWLIPWGTPLTLLADEPAELSAAQRQLVRIGIDRPSGGASGGIDAWDDGATERRTYPVARFADAAASLAQRDDVVIVDLRRGSEWEEGHVEGAVHLPIHELPARMHELPDGELWVHCSSGFRASIGASLLDRAGRRVVLVDDEATNAEAAGLPVTGTVR